MRVSKRLDRNNHTLHVVFSVVDVLRPGGFPCPLAVEKPFGCSSCCQAGAECFSPSPYIRYWTPRNESHAAWNMPQILNAHGIVVDDVKNQNIFMLSPSSQLASTESRNPLQDRERAFARIWGMGRIASTERPMIPIADEYDWYTEGRGDNRSSQTTRPANRVSRNCQYLFQTSAPSPPRLCWLHGNPRLR